MAYTTLLAHAHCAAETLCDFPLAVVSQARRLFLAAVSDGLLSRNVASRYIHTCHNQIELRRLSIANLAFRFISPRDSVRLRAATGSGRNKVSTRGKVKRGSVWLRTVTGANEGDWPARHLGLSALVSGRRTRRPPKRARVHSLQAQMPLIEKKLGGRSQRCGGGSFSFWVSVAL